MGVTHNFKIIGITENLNTILNLNKRLFTNTFTDFCKDKSQGLCLAGLVLDNELVEVFHHGDLSSVAGNNITSIKFPIASMTKVFCAASILRLRDEGKLSLDVPVGNILSGLNRGGWKDITLRHLLTMNAGLPYDNPWGDRLLDKSEEEVDNILREEILFASKPGESFNYSNLSYIILGKVVGAISGMPFLDYIKTFLLAPLEMNETGWLSGPGSAVDGLNFERGEWKLISPVEVKGYPAAFAGLVSTLSDLSKWIAFMQDAYFKSNNMYERIVSSGTRIEMQSSLIEFPNIKSYGFSRFTKYYGMGVVCQGSGPTASIGHSGGLPGYGSHFRWSTSQKVGVIFLSNHTYLTGADKCGSVLDEAVLNYTNHQLSLKPNVEERAKALAELLTTFNLEIIESHFSSNFLLDSPIEDFKEKVLVLNSKMKNSETPTILPEPGLAGLIAYSQFSIYFSLSPGEGGKIQEVIFY